uniref:Uncharacterized protein n=1 Tax=Branchiostoma floridae TaxID=7739 RepID=C3ZW74_BRAFL|eukprot:XP_002587194.1 hypothetical protein BRAFLDRAFT_102080 [Branchiostoma floridae]
MGLSLRSAGWWRQLPGARHVWTRSRPFRGEVDDVNHVMQFGDADGFQFPYDVFKRQVHDNVNVVGQARFGFLIATFLVVVVMVMMVMKETGPSIDKGRGAHHRKKDERKAELLELVSAPRRPPSTSSAAAPSSENLATPPAALCYRHGNKKRHVTITVTKAGRGCGKLCQACVMLFGCRQGALIQYTSSSNVCRAR